MIKNNGLLDNEAVHIQILYPRAVLHLEDGVGLFCYGGVVGDDDDRAALVVGEGAKDLYYVFGVGRVKIARRLVGEDDLASLRKCARDRYSLLLTARKMGGKAVVVVCREFHPFAHLLTERRGFFFGHFLQIERVADVFLNGQKREEIVILINYADRISAHTVSVPLLGRFAVDYDLTLGGQIEARHKREKRGLSRTGFADDGITLTGLEIIRHTVHRADGLIFSFVAVRYVVKRDTHLFVLLDGYEKVLAQEYAKCNG